MTRVEDMIEVDSPASSVWAVMVDPSYLPKLYPDIITVSVKPPGMMGLGTKAEIIARLGKVRVEIYLYVTRADTEACFATRQDQAGLFKSMEQVFYLENMGQRTRVKAVFDYTLVPEYAATITQEEFLDSRVADNLRWFTRNLKEICELLPLPS